MSFLKLFSKKDFIVFGFLYLGLVIYSFLEIFSIALIPAFVQLIIDPQKINEFYYHPWLAEHLTKENLNNLILIASIIIVTIFLIKNLFLVLITYLNEKKTSNWLSNLTHNFIKKVLDLSYENFIMADHAKLTNIVINEFETIRHVIRTYFIILKELLVLILVCITFIYISPFYFMMLFMSMIFFSVIFFFFLRNVLKSSGSKSQELKGAQIKVMDVIFRGIKYIKVFDKSKYFSNFLFNLTKKRNGISANIASIQILPKLLIEIILLLLFLITCNLLFIIFEGTSDQFIITLSLIAVMVVRLIPIYTNLNVSFIFLKFASPAVKSITNYFKDEKIKELENHFENSKTFDEKFESIEVKNINYKFKTKTTSEFSIDAINFTLKKGEKIGVIGNTGSGKSTLINCVLGLLKPDKGDIIINKKDSIFSNIKSWQKKISFVPQDIFLMDSNIYQNISLSHEVNDEEIKKIDNIIKLTKLDKFINNFDLHLGDKTAKISEGEKQRVGICRALFKDSEVLILDETTSSLDVNTEKEIMMNLNENFKDMTILTIAHRLSTVENYDKIILMENGKTIMIDDPKTVINFFTKDKIN
tara:strand:+ start:7688 stop:9451 length:1764 start_codon:yes stop_codon:yes gene_type:complete